MNRMPAYFYITRPDGRYFKGPAQLEHFRWSRHFHDAMPFYNRRDAERTRDVHSEVDGIDVVEKDCLPPPDEPWR